MGSFILYLISFLVFWIGSVVTCGVVAGHKKLSVVGFVFLALFIGPIALLVVFLVPASSANKPGSTPSLQGLLYQLSSIRQTIAALSKRVIYLEGIINCQISKESSPDQIQEANADQGQEKEPQKDEQQTEPVETVADDLSGKEAKKKEEFEFVFGKYWLNRIGIIITFLGGAFFIAYYFKHLNAFAKIFIGYLFAALFFLWGNFLLKRKQYAKLATGVLGGAWGFLYLVTYAMHYIDATRIISSPIAELMALALVSFAAIFYNLKYRSQVVTSFTFLLAFITAGLGPVDYYSVVYCALLTACIVFFSIRLKWNKFLIFAICGIYFTYIYWLLPHVFSSFLVSERFSIPVYQFQLASGLLFASWLIFSFGLIVLKIEQKERLRFVIWGILLNAFFFILLELNELYRIQDHLAFNWDIHYWFLVSMSAFYFLFAFIYKKTGKQQLIVACSSISFTLIAVAIFIRFPSLSVGFFWLLQMGLLFMLGVYYKERIFRIMAFILGVCLFLRLASVDYFSIKTYLIFSRSIPHNIVIFLISALIYYLIGAISHKKEIIAKITKDEALFSSIFYSILGALLLTTTRFLDFRISFYWLLQAIGLFILSQYHKARVYRILYLILCVIIFFRLLISDFNYGVHYSFLGLNFEHNTLIFIITTVCFYLFRIMVNQKNKTISSLPEENAFSILLVVLGTILITFLYSEKVASRWITSVWALQGIGLLGIGFILRDKVFRICSLSILSLACLRLLFSDLAGVDTIYRIIAFIFLGAVLLAASMVYSKFIAKVSQEKMEVRDEDN